MFNRTFRKLLLILLTTLPEIKCENVEKAYCSDSGSRKLNEQCGGYCYKVAKPLLQYASAVQSMENQFTDLTIKAQSLEATIKSLETQLEVSKKYCLEES